MSFFIFENNCIQSHEIHQLSTQFGILAHLFFLNKPMRPEIFKKFHTTEKDKVKTRVKDECEKFNQILRERGVEAVKTKINVSIDFYVFNCVF